MQWEELMWKSVVWIVPMVLLMTAAPHAQSAAKYAAKDGDKAEKKVEVTIKDRKFKPANVKVLKGGTVTWVNDDQHEHTVDEEDGAFKSGVIKPGKNWKYTFEKAGKYSYACKLHPRMKGTVVVE